MGKPKQQPRSGYEQPDYPAPSAVGQKKPRRRRWIIVLGVVVLLVIVIVAVSQSSDTNNAEQTSDNSPAKDEPEGPATTITSGTYEVGVDVQPGRYKTSGPPDDDIIGCYWARHKDDSGSIESIIANANLEGPGSVTINSGEFFEAGGECTWSRVG
jgi:hypothetical protein